MKSPKQNKISPQNFLKNLKMGQKNSPRVFTKIQNFRKSPRNFFDDDDDDEEEEGLDKKSLEDYEKDMKSIVDEETMTKIKDLLSKLNELPQTDEDEDEEDKLEQKKKNILSELDPLIKSISESQKKELAELKEVELKEIVKGDKQEKFLFDALRLYYLIQRRKHGNEEIPLIFTRHLNINLDKLSENYKKLYIKETEDTDSELFYLLHAKFSSSYDYDETIIGLENDREPKQKYKDLFTKFFLKELKEFKEIYKKTDGKVKKLKKRSQIKKKSIKIKKQKTKKKKSKRGKK